MEINERILRVQRMADKTRNLEAALLNLKAEYSKNALPVHSNLLCFMGLHKAERVLLDDHDFSFYFAVTRCLRCGSWGWQKNRTPNKSKCEGDDNYD